MSGPRDFLGVHDAGLVYVGVSDFAEFTLIGLPVVDHAPRPLLTKTATVKGVGRDVMIVFQHWKPREDLAGTVPVKVFAGDDGCG